MGRLRFAASRLEAVLGARPDHVGALHHYGWITGALGRHEESLAAYERLVALAPGSSDARSGCGSALQSLGRHDEAIAQFTVALDSDPDNPLIQYNLAVSLTAAGRLQDALAVYTRLARQHPDHPEAAGNLAATLGELGHWKEAADWARRAMSLAPTALHARNLGIALFELGEYAEAETAFRAAAVRESGWELETRLAMAVAHQDRYGEAEQMLLRVLRDHRADEHAMPIVYEALGRTYLEMGNAEEGLRCFDAALALDADNADLQEGRRRALSLSRGAAGHAPDVKPRRAELMATLSSAEVATYLKNFLEGRGGPWDWDDFLSMHLDDPVLEAIRLQCGALPDKFPPAERGHYCGPEGIVKLQELLESLADRDR